MSKRKRISSKFDKQDVAQILKVKRTHEDDKENIKNRSYKGRVL